MSIERRIHTRKPLHELAYLSLPLNNGGIVTDISEGGLGFHAIAPLEGDGPLRIRFAFDSAERITAVGELAWKDASGKVGGLRFTQLPDGVREQIRAWSAQSAAGSTAAPGGIPKNPSANVVAHAAGGRNNFAASVDVLVAEPPPGTDLASDLRAHALPAVEAFLASSANAAGVAPAEKKPYFQPRYKTAITQAAKLPGILPAQAIAAVLPDPKSVIAEPAQKADAAVDTKMDRSTAHDTAVAVPAVETKTATHCKAVFVPAVPVRRPTLYSLRPPIYSAPSYELSMFPIVRKPEAAAVRAVFVTPKVNTANVTNPLAAVVLTILLAFVVSMGIFVYVSTTWAGQLLFRWEEEIWSGFYSRSLPQSLEPPGSVAPDRSSLPRQ